MRASQLMTSPVITVGPETPVKEAARILSENRISALPVVDDQGHLMGIVSEGDLLPLETSPDPRSQLAPLPARGDRLPSRVEEVMTRDVLTVSEDTDVGVAAQQMLEAGVKRLPVLRGLTVVGILSRHDLLKVLARDDATIEENVRAALTQEGRRMSELEVKVEGGVVQLSGTDDVRLLRVADVLVRSVPGVLDVRHGPRAT
jgi:CBS domain-containing protein